MSVIMTWNLIKQRQLEKRNKNKISSKRKESEILVELRTLLEEYLKDNDRVMIEVNSNALTEFIAVMDSISSIYNYRQEETNLFVFSNKDLF